MSISKIWCLFWLINTWIQIHYPDLILLCLYVLYFTTRWIFNDSDVPHVLVTDPNILICLVWWIQLDYSFSTRFFPKLIAKNYETETVLHVIIIKLVLLANWIESFSLQMHVSCDPSFYWILLLIILTSNCISFPKFKWLVSHHWHMAPWSLTQKDACEWTREVVKICQCDLDFRFLLDSTADRCNMILLYESLYLWIKHLFRNFCIKIIG